jgi:hypothetical protein
MLKASGVQLSGAVAEGGAGSAALDVRAKIVRAIE